ncbi:thioesterase family protein [Candidatus Bipolaricaulota bacterium]|nr:thioesterase family protein [Candidatus Bipolaricaulota bacterium]
MYEVGTVSELTWIVSKEHLASAFGSGLVDVLATPVLVGFCEEAARTMIDPSLPAGQKTVGTAISLTHTAATPLGMKVTIRATLTAIEGRKLGFDIECADEIESVGHGEHTRFIIDAARFDAGIADKAAKRTSR